MGAQFPPAHLVVNTMVIALGLISVPVRGDGHLQIALFPCARRSVKTVASVSLLIHVNVTNSQTSLEISDREEVVLSFRRKMETPWTPAGLVLIALRQFVCKQRHLFIITTNSSTFPTTSHFLVQLYVEIHH